MTTTTRVPVRDPSKHEYLIVPIVDGAHRWPMRSVAQVVRETTGERKAVEAAQAMMAERLEVERVHVYHSHPSPGPMSRYIGIVARGTDTIRRPA
jgi:hypothetical protein